MLGSDLESLLLPGIFSKCLAHMKSVHHYLHIQVRTLQQRERVSHLPKTIQLESRGLDLTSY